MLPIETPSDHSCSSFKSYERKASSSTSSSHCAAATFLDLDPSPNLATIHFSIRDYTFTSRTKDIATNWPFPTQYLQTCLEHGVKDLLPPFDPPPYPVRIFEGDDLISQCSCQQDFIITPTPAKKQKLKPNNKRPPSTSGNNEADDTISVRDTTHLVKPVPTSKLSQKKKLLLVRGSSSSPDQPPPALKAASDLTSNPTMVSDFIASKVCPVCKTFASSSNTTLNAHIDQCLSEDTTDVNINDGVLSIPIIKHKANPCKKRSMVDIYATSTFCTLEDLDRRNGTTWALDLGSVGQSSTNASTTVSNSEIKRPKICTVTPVDDENDGAVYVDSNGTKVCILSKLNSSKALDVAGAEVASDVRRKIVFGGRKDGLPVKHSKVFGVKFQIDKSASSNPPVEKKMEKKVLLEEARKMKKKNGRIAKLRRNIRHMHSDPSNKLNGKLAHITGESGRELNLPSSSAKSERTPRTPRSFQVEEEKEKNALMESCFPLEDGVGSKKKVRSQRSSMKKKMVSNSVVVNGGFPEEVSAAVAETTTTMASVTAQMSPDQSNSMVQVSELEECRAVPDIPKRFDNDNVVVVEEEQPSEGDPVVAPPYVNGDNKKLISGTEAWVELFASRSEPDDGPINPNVETSPAAGDMQFGERRFHQAATLNSPRVVSCVEILHQPRSCVTSSNRPLLANDQEHSNMAVKEREASGSPASSTISHPMSSKDLRDSEAEMGKSPRVEFHQPPRSRSRPMAPCCCSHGESAGIMSSPPAWTPYSNIPETNLGVIETKSAEFGSKPVLRLMGKNLMVVNKEDDHHLQQQLQAESPSLMNFAKSEEHCIDPYRRPLGYHHQQQHLHPMYSMNGSSGGVGFPYLQFSGNHRYFQQNPTTNMLPDPRLSPPMPPSMSSTNTFMGTQKRSNLRDLQTHHQNMFYNPEFPYSPRHPGGGGAPAGPMSMMLPIYPFQPREVIREVSNYGGNMPVYHPVSNYYPIPSETTPATLPPQLPASRRRRLHHLTPPTYFNSPPSLRH